MKKASLRSAWRRLARTDALSNLTLALVTGVSLVILALLAIVVWLSFLEGHPGDAHQHYDLGNYIDIFSEDETYEVVFNTFGFSLVTLFVALVFGVPAAWLVERTDLPGKTLVYTLMTLGLLIPGFASAMGWLFLLHPRIGLINLFLIEQFGLSEGPIGITNIVGMGWVLGLNLAPLAFIMLAAVFRSMDPALEEVAQASGANLRQTIWRVTLPLAWPGILAASLYIFTIGFAAFDVPAIIGWSNRIFTFSTYVLVLLSPEDGLPRYGAVAALSVVIIGMAGLMSWWYSAMQHQSLKYAVVTGKAYRPRIARLERYTLLAWSFILFYVLLSKILPLLILVWTSLLPYFVLPSAEALSGISLDNYRGLPWNLTTRGLKNTVILMVLTPTVTVALSVAFSWIVVRSEIPGRSNFDVIAFLPHAVPNIVFSIGALLLTLFILERFVPIYGTVWILLAVFVVARLSYGTRMTNSGFIQIHRELEEAAQASGAGTWAVMHRVVVPLLAPTLLYAWLWISLLTFRELSLAVILTTSGNVTLPVVIWSMWSSGGLSEAAALALVMLGIMTPLILIYWVLARRRGMRATAS